MSEESPGTQPILGTVSSVTRSPETPSLQEAEFFIKRSPGTLWFPGTLFSLYVKEVARDAITPGDTGRDAIGPEESVTWDAIIPGNSVFCS